jgi:hypothetical protein
MSDDIAISLAERLKQTVHLARAYSSGTGSIFEDAMTEAERLADRALIDLRARASMSHGEKQ